MAKKRQRLTMILTCQRMARVKKKGASIWDRPKTDMHNRLSITACLITLILLPISVCAGDANITVINYGKKYTYSVFLNHEPIYFGGDFSSVSWVNYPIKEGANELTLHVQCLSQDRTRVHIRVNQSDTDTLPIVDWRAYVNGDSIETNVLFQVREAVPKTMKFDAFKFSETVSNKMIATTLRLSSAFAAADTNEMVKIVNVAANRFMTNFPKWFLARSSPLTITKVESASDLKIICGERFAMIEPSSVYLQKNTWGELVSVSDPQQDAEIGRSALIFCQVNGRLGLLESDGTFSELRE